MGYNPSTQVITAAVGIHDVQRALGVSSNDLYTLARSGNIHRLSPYKPIRGNLNGYSDKPGEMSDTDLINRNLGFVMPEFPFTKSGTTYDFNTVIKAICAEDAIPWLTMPGYSDVDSRGTIGNGWVYNMPVANTHYARLTDFNHYDHSQKNAYENTTFEVLAGSKIVQPGQAANTYTGNFFVKLDPFAPHNFASLYQKRVGVAFVIGTNVYFFIGKGSDDGSYIGTKAMGARQTWVNVPDVFFREIIDNKCSGNNDITIYVVGFMAPNSYAGYQNIKSGVSGYTYQSNPNSMNGLIPLPGLDYDTITWQHSGSVDGYVTLTGNGEFIITHQDTSTIKLMTATNLYNGTAQFYLRSDALRYTFEIKNASNQQVWPTNGQPSTSYESFDYFTPVDISNDTAGVQKTTVLANSGCTDLLSLPDNTYSVNGYKVLVHLWYMPGLNPQGPPNTSEMYEAGSFVIQIGDTPPLD